MIADFHIKHPAISGMLFFATDEQDFKKRSGFISFEKNILFNCGQIAVADSICDYFTQLFYYE